jgi:low temperature requirement protein LtrA
VERHGLVVLVAFGESVVAIGAAVGNSLTLRLLAAALLTLTVCVGLWWAYFGHDDDKRAEEFMASLDDARRNHLAVMVYNLGHYFLLLGVLLLATGAKSAVAHPTHQVAVAQAAALASGAAMFLLANTGMRHTIGLRPVVPRVVAAVALIATIPLGAEVTALTQVGMMAVLLGVTFGYEEWSATARAVARPVVA